MTSTDFADYTDQEESISKLRHVALIAIYLLGIVWDIGLNL